jgi:tetratricopeptide (TPR) repeat protein
LISTLQRKKDYNELALSITPAFEALDWTQPKAAGDSTPKPQDVFISKYGGVYLLSLFEIEQKEYARSQLARIHTYMPDWADGYSFSAYIDLKKQNWAGAIPILQAGVKNCPDNADLWLSLGDSQYFLNPNSKEQIKKAKEAYLKAKQLGNKDAAEKYNLLNK